VQKNSVELVETTGRSLEELAAAGRLASVFCRLARSRFTGVVYVEHEDEGGVFTFRNGMPIYVEDLGNDGMLCDQLFAQGLITSEQHSEISAAAIGSATENEDLAFCEQAVQLGVLSQAQVDAELERRLRARLIQAVGFTESRIEIDADPEVVAAVPEYPLDLGPLIHTGVRTFFDEEAVQRVLGTTDDLYVRLSVPCSDAVQFFDLGSDEEDLVMRLDPQTSVERTIAQCAADPFDAWQLVCMLVIAELAELSRVPFAPASDRSGLRTTHAISARQPSSARITVPREDEESAGSGRRASVARQDVVNTGSVARMPAVRAEVSGPQPRSSGTGVARPPSAPVMPAARERMAQAPEPRPASAPAFEPPRNSGEVQRSAQARPAQRADSAKFVPPSREAQPVRVSGPSQASNMASGRTAMRTSGPGAQDAILPTDRTKPRRKLSAALQRLDRGLKDLRGPAAAPATPAASPQPDPAAAGPAGSAHAHVEQLLRMRAQQMVQKKVEVDSGQAAVDAHRQGQEALRDHQFARAHELLRRACELAPSDAALRLQMEWAALRAGALDEEGIGKLRGTLRELVNDNDQKKFAYYALGHVALVEKKDDAAEKFFRKAVELDKNNKDAERHLRIIELRRKSAAEERGNKIFGIELGKKKS